MRRVVNVRTGLLSQLWVGETWQARAPSEAVSQPQAEETGRRPGQLRQQPSGDHHQMRRPHDHRIRPELGAAFVVATAVTAPVRHEDCGRSK